MIETRFFDRNPLTGATTLYHYDHADDIAHFETVEDHQPVTDANTRFHIDNTDANWRGDMHLVASLPLTVWFDLKKRGILDDDKALRRWLNDPDNMLFRTRPGRV